MGDFMDNDRVVGLVEELKIEEEFKEESIMDVRF